jgi:hypothetical protein
LAVVLAAVVRVLDLDPMENAMARQAKHTEGWRLHHLDRVGRELASNLIFAPIALAHATLRALA